MHRHIKRVNQALTKVLNALNTNKETLALCLDLSRAFDSVKYDILFKKLESYGFRGMALKLVSSYLDCRRQCVVAADGFGGTLASSMRLVRRGVPQGSILGPLLYILYSNELPGVTCHHTVQYADDTTLIFDIEGTSSADAEMERALTLLKIWFD